MLALLTVSGTPLALHAPAPPPPSEAANALRAWRGHRATAVQRLAVRYGTSEGLAERIFDAAVEENVGPDLAFRLVAVESSFRPEAVSSQGAVGLTQLLPSTARWLDPTVTRAELLDSDTNLRLGFRYLRHLLDRNGGNVRLALLAYNRGPTRVARMLRAGEDPANGYARRVLTL